MCTIMFQFFFCSRKMFLMANSKKFVPYFYNHNKNLYNKFEIWENYVFLLFKFVLEPWSEIQ